MNTLTYFTIALLGGLISVLISTLFPNQRSHLIRTCCTALLLACALTLWRYLFVPGKYSVLLMPLFAILGVSVGFGVGTYLEEQIKKGKNEKNR